MSMQILTKSLEDGYYPSLKARKNELGHPIAPLVSFAADAEKQGVVPEAKELEAAEKYWLNYLQVQDWESRRAKKVKAFARTHAQLEAIFADQKQPMTGDAAGNMEKAFSVTPLQVIFPIFYDTMVMRGLLAEPLLDVLIMETVSGNFGTFDHAAMNESVADRTMGETGEFATFAELNISATNAPIKTHKFGGILNVSDEAIRRARIPVYAYGVERIGRQLAIDLTDFALDVLLNGDGNAGAATSVASVVSHQATFADWLAVLYAFKIGYKPTDVIISKAGLTRLLNIPEMKDPWAFGMSNVFQASGIPPTPFGLTLHRWDSTGSTTWSNSGALDVILMLQRERGLIMYMEGGLNTESERVINGEYTRTKTSLYVGYGNWDGDARIQGTGF